MSAKSRASNKRRRTSSRRRTGDLHVRVDRRGDENVGTGQPRERARLSERVLLLLYVIIPISVAIALGDVFLAHRFLGKHLPILPEALLVFALIFDAPHLVGSTILLADREYLKFHGRRFLIGGAVLLAIVTLVPHLVGEDAFWIGVMAYTVYHVVGQQAGVAKLLSRVDGPLFLAWKVILILGAFGVFAGLFYPSGALNRCVEVACLAVTVCTVPLVRRSKRRVGSAYIVLNTTMIWACYACLRLHEPFFAVLMPRVVHDATAFAFYVTHDRNRNAEESKNLFHRLLSGASRSKATPYLTPALALLIAYPITAYCRDSDSLAWIYLFVSAFHFYTEGFTWKGTSPHRRYVAFG
jgi:hypothetical protein